MRSNNFRQAFTVALIAVASLAPASAFAQGSSKDSDPGYTEKKTDDGSSVVFTDADWMTGASLGPIGSQLTGFHPPKRFPLMRPRLQFVPEMLKTVENM
jgi:hypothetical protein